MGVRSILVIEDDLAFASILSAFFRRVLPDVHVQHTDKLPVQTPSVPYDFVLCDLHLPNTPPEQVFAGLDCETIGSKVVFMSSDTDEIRLLRAFFRGNYQALPKDRLFFSKLECMLIEKVGELAY